MPVTTRAAVVGLHHRISCRSVLSAVAAVCLGAVAVSGPAAAEEKATVPQWQSILALQLRDTHKCDLDKVLFSRDVRVGDEVSTEGRARCLDGREYDFTRDRAHEKFTLRLCQPTVC